MGHARCAQDASLLGSWTVGRASPRRTSSTYGSVAIRPAFTSRFTNVSALSKLGYSHAEPFSQNERRGRFGQGHVIAIAQRTRRQERHEGAELKWTRSIRRPRGSPPASHSSPARER